MIDCQLMIAEQKKKASQIITKDQFSAPVSLIAGADVGFEQNGQITRAAIAILTYPALTLVEYKIARINTVLPYIPGLLSFRELPALISAWQSLTLKPQLIMVDGHGISHPRRLGVASHFGLTVDVPTIGVAKKRLCGCALPVGDEIASKQPLLDNEKQIGWVWRSKLRCNPLYISVGHKISLSTALMWVEYCMRGYRLPEPTRWADAIASERPLFMKWLQQHSVL